MTPRESTIHRTALLESALHYGRRGWPVFPLHSVRRRPVFVPAGLRRNSGKHPRTEHGLLDATTDPDRIRSWWARWPDANVGIPTGARRSSCWTWTPRRAGT